MTETEAVLQRASITYARFRERVAGGQSIGEAFDDMAMPWQSVATQLDVLERARHGVRTGVFALGLAEGMSVGELSLLYGFSRQLAARVAKEAREVQSDLSGAPRDSPPQSLAPPGAVISPMRERSAPGPITVRWSPTSSVLSPVGKKTCSPCETDVTRSPAGSCARRIVLPATGESVVTVTSADPVVTPRSPIRCAARNQLLAISPHDIGDRECPDHPAVAVEDRYPRLLGRGEALECHVEPAGCRHGGRTCVDKFTHAARGVAHVVQRRN